MFITFSGVFLVIFYLYNLPLEPVFYSILLCATFGIAIVVISFFRFKVKHDIFVNLRKSIELSLNELPEPENIRDDDYTELIKVVFDAKSKAESDKALAVTDMTDYYTLWAHQIKTPISAMRLLLQSEDTDMDELSEQLFKIEEYVQMVLTYLRCDSSANDYVIKRCNIDDIIKEAVRKYAKQFIRKKISLDYTGLDFDVVTDEKWLLFVIEQVISNALKYTKEGKISIYSAGKCIVVIEDTGIGISPEDLPRVCEKGYTGYNGRADKKSTGIGLYLCKMVLQGLSHRLTIESEVGKGTRVKIDLATINTVYE